MTDSQNIPHDDFFDSLLSDFLDESSQLLDRLGENLLALEEWARLHEGDPHEHCDREMLNDMFRSAHSLKGLSAMLGLKAINTLTHKIENVFDAARRDLLVVTPQVVELLFEAMDRLSALIERLTSPDMPPVESDAVLDQIHALLETAGVEQGTSTQADAERALAAAAAIAPELSAATEPACQGPNNADPNNDSQAESPTPGNEPPKTPVADSFAGVVDETDLPTKYLGIFVDEAAQSLDDLTETLLAVEREGGAPDFETLLVTSHRIKGSAASVGVHRVAKLAHRMEDALQELVAHQKTLTPSLVDAMLHCTDGLRHYVEELRHGSTHFDQFGQLADELSAALGAATATDDPRAEEHVPSAEPKPVAPATVPESPVQAADLVEKSRVPQGHSQETPGDRTRPSVAASSTAPVAEKPAQPTPAEPDQSQPETPTVTPAVLAEVCRHAPSGNIVLAGEVVFHAHLPLASLKGRLVYEKLANLGRLCYFEPPVEVIDQLEDLSGVAFGLITEIPSDVVLRQIRISGVERVALQAVTVTGVSAIDAPYPPETLSSPARAESAAKGHQELVVPIAAGQQAASSVAAKTQASSPAVGSRSAAESAGKTRPAETGPRPTETLRVDIERLDELMNLAGQLVISKARFAEIGDRLRVLLQKRDGTRAIAGALSKLQTMTQEGFFDDEASDDIADRVRRDAFRIANDLEVVRHDAALLADARGAVGDLFEAIHQLERVSNGIQQSVMDTRMVPIGPLFTRFKRVVRDLSRINGKSIRLVIDGEKTELDKRMIDELGDPLIHMVRNSADHGIEPPEVRRAAGKPAEGTISLDAFHRGNNIVIQIRDDGKGLDAAKILSKAIERGLVTPTEAERMTRQQIFQLIWEPGLSTAEKVTEVSGRGVGMDIVKSKIDTLGGSIDIESVAGQGTTFSVRLPLTLAILPSLMVRIDDDTFAMPLESVVEIVSIGKGDLATLHGQWTARVRQRIISVVKLSEAFRWNNPLRNEGTTTNEGGKEQTLVVVGEGSTEIGIVVDNVLGEEDVVIKSLAENYRNVAGVAGACILGDGRVSLILDVAALVEMACGRYKE